MPPYVLGGIASIALALALLVWSLPGRVPGRRRALVNLEQGLPPRAQPAAQEHPDAGPDATAAGTWGRRIVPAGTVRRLERLYAQAGSPARWPVARLLTVKLALPVVALLVGLAYAQAVPGRVTVLLITTVVVVTFFLPELLLHSQSQERNKKIALELPDLLDQVSISVEAGLGFDAAVARAGRNRQSPLGEELRRTYQDLQLGQSRRQAYESLARRTGAHELEKFVQAVLQADAYGVPMADVLRTQANEARLKRRQHAEERAMQIPTKVIFPVMLLILPVMFIVLLGPAVIDVLRTFG
jgi:tight adherence protein C